MRIVLVVDMDYMVWRSFHGNPFDMRSPDGIPTGVVFTVLRSLLALENQFNPTHWVLGWDSRTSLRKDLFTGYKANRKPFPDGDVEAESRWHDLLLQKKWLTIMLSRTGFHSLCLDGLEGDDILAGVAAAASKKDTTYMMTSDLDLLQCVQPHVLLHDPARKVTWNPEKVKTDKGVSPQGWALVKAIAGCKTDNVPGVPGIGEKTAVRYLQGKATPRVCELVDANWGLVEANSVLTRLPFQKLEVRPESRIFNFEEWRAICRTLGMASIADERFRFGA
jgi:DNA polymerase-1